MPGANGSPGCIFEADWIKSLHQRQGRDHRELTKFQQKMPDDNPFVEDWEQVGGINFVERCCNDVSGLIHGVRKAGGKAHRVGLPFMDFTNKAKVKFLRGA